MIRRCLKHHRNKNSRIRKTTRAKIFLSQRGDNLGSLQRKMSIGVSNSSCQTHEWWFRVSKRRAVISSEKLLVVVVEKLTKKRSLEEKEDDGFSGSRQEEESSYVEFYGGPTQRKTQKRRSSFKRQLGFLLREAPSSKKSLLLDKRTSISSSNYLNNNSHTATSSFMSVEDFRGSYRQTKQEIIMMIPDASSHLISFWKQRGSPVKRNKTWGRNGRLTSYTWFSWTNWWADFHETPIKGPCCLLVASIPISESCQLKSCL